MIDDQPISRGTPLGQLLDRHAVPELPAGFADRVLARTQDRAPPLPEPRRQNAGGKRWRSVRRFGIGVVAVGAVASAAAATGLLDDLPVQLPSADQVWNALTGEDTGPGPDPGITGSTSASDPNTGANGSAAPPSISDGPITSPEQLEKVFRRFDEVRAERRDTRRQRFDDRMDRVIERRLDNGNTPPTPEQEQRMRDRIEQLRERRESRADDLIEQRRDRLRERVESGDEIIREDFIPQQSGDRSGPARARRPIEELRNLSPEERRQRLRQWRDDVRGQGTPGADQSARDPDNGPDAANEGSE